jgi:hypothetical protein
MGTPDYYFIKLGVGGTNLPNTHYLYKNNADLRYAVVDITAWGGSGNNINIGRVSHVGEINSPAPEPATVLLLGVGLAGLVGFGRKKFQKSN